MPGVSRNGATLTAARARRFTRDQANLLSRTVALPVIVGATALKGTRLRRRGVTPGTGRTLALRGRGRVRVDARLAAPDRPGRARPGAVAVRGLPRGAAPRSWQAERERERPAWGHSALRGTFTANGRDRDLAVE